jgi:hypothetical protein
VLELREKVLGLEHPDILATRNNLALVLRDRDKSEAAEEMHRQALELSRLTIGSHDLSSFVSQPIRTAGGHHQDKSLSGQWNDLSNVGVLNMQI